MDLGALSGGGNTHLRVPEREPFGRFFSVDEVTDLQLGSVSKQEGPGGRRGSGRGLELRALGGARGRIRGPASSAGRDAGGGGGSAPRPNADPST